MVRYLAGVLLLGTAAMAASPYPPSPTTKTFFPSCRRIVRAAIGRARSARSSFLTYQSTRPWAKAIKEAVLTKKMPPWFADPSFGHFANDRRLNEADLKTLVAWVDAGAPEGDRKTCRLPSNGATDGTSNRTS